MFQDFSQAASARAPERMGGSLALDQASELVARYPKLDQGEVDRLASLYRELSALDVALLMADQQLAPRLERFVDEHSSKVRTPLRDYALLLAIVASGALLVVWAVAFGV